LLHGGYHFYMQGKILSSINLPSKDDSVSGSSTFDLTFHFLHLSGLTVKFRNIFLRTIGNCHLISFFRNNYCRSCPGSLIWLHIPQFVIGKMMILATGKASYFLQHLDRTSPEITTVFFDVGVSPARL